MYYCRKSFTSVSTISVKDLVKALVKGFFIVERAIAMNNLAMELISQLTEVKATVDASNGIATISGKRDGKNLSFAIEQRDYEEIKLASSDESRRKSDCKEEVKRLHKNRLKQKKKSPN